MILCTISQFSALHSHLGSELIAQNNITSEEVEFIQIIHDYESRENDNELVYLIDRYEHIFNDINVTRLVALKLLSYHHQVPMLKYDPTLIESYKAQTNQANPANATSQKPLTPTSPRQSAAKSVEPPSTLDPILEVASGHFLNP